MRNKKNEVQMYQPLEATSPILESYRMLRTNIEFSSSVKKISCILITSSVSGEGKTTISVNLAKVFALSGKKVLVVDLDLRCPSVHKIMNADNKKGIMACLLNKETPENIVRSTDTENLFYVNCGDIPTNPAELLSSDKLKNIIDGFTKEYDLVILDSPPCSSLADASIASRLADTVILIVSAGRAKLYEVSQAKNNLEKAGTPILGIVMNNLTNRPRGYKYNSYYSY